MRVLVTIKTTQTATFDIGDLPINLVRDLLVKHDGTFDGNWAPSDVTHNEKYVTDEVTVEPVEVKAKAK